MGKNKKHRAKKSALNRAVDYSFEALGLTVALSPAIEGVAESISTPSHIPRGIAYKYTGFDIQTGGHSVPRMTQGLLTVAVGGVIAGVPRIFRFVRKLVRGR